MTCPPYYDIWSSSNRMATSDLEALGEDTSDLVNGFSKYAEELKALTGFDILVEGTTDTYKDIYDIFEGISKVWKDLSDTQQSRVSEILGGVRQLQVVSSIFNNMSDAAGAYSDALNSVGVASNANATYMESVGAKADRMKAAFQEMANTIIDSNLIGMVYDVGTVFAELLTLGDGFVAKAAIITAAILGISAALSAFQTSSLKTTFTGMLTSISQIYPYLQILGSVAKTGVTDFTQWSAALSKMSSSQLASIAVTNANTLGLKKLNEEELKKQLIDAKVAKSTAEAAAAQAAQTVTTKAQSVANASAIVTMDGLKTATSGLGVAIKSFVTAHPWLVFAAAVGVAVAIIDKVVVSFEESKQKLSELASESQDARTELSSLTTELENVIKKRDELQAKSDAGTITFVEAEELERLKEVSAELDKQKKLQNTLVENTQRAEQKQFTETVKNYQTGRPEPTHARTNEQINNDNLIKYKNIVDEISQVTQKLIDAQENNDVSAINRWQKQLDALQEDLGEYRDDLDSAYQTVYDFVSGRSRIQHDDGTVLEEWEQEYNDFYDWAQEFLDRYNVVVNGIGAKTVKFNSILSSPDFTTVVNNLNSLGKAGQVSEDILNSTDYSGFIAACQACGITIQELIDYFNALYEAPVVQDKTEPINNLKTALASLTDETTILRTALKALENGNLEKFLIGSDKKAENLKELISAFPELEDEINAYSKGLISATELQRAFSLSLTISPIEQASDDLNKLSTALSNFKSKASLETSDFIDLQKIFGGLDEYQEFEKVASNSKSTFEQVKAAADKLGTAYLNTRDMLGDLNESTAEHTILALKGIGVLNAEEVVYGRLAAQKNQNVIATRAFNDIEWEAASIQNMFATATLSVRDALNKFKNQQKETQAVTIDLTTATSAEIQAFTMLARAIGLTDTSLFNALSNMQKLKKAVEEGRYIGAYYNEYINSWQKTINDAFADFDISVPELNFSVPKGNISKGSSSSASKTQEYKAKIDKLHKQTQALEEIQNRIEKANAKAKLIDDKNYKELIKHHESLIEMYKEEQNALHDLATARRAVIQENVDKLREVGFNIDYNASDNSILIENMEHINQLAAKSKGTYSNLQEATNAYRKEIEELIKDTVDMVSANRDDSNSWWDLQQSIKDAKVDIVNALNDIADSASKAVDDMQSVYDTLHEAADEYAASGAISADVFQSLLSLGAQYMQYLEDENGLLVINEERIKSVIAARTEQMAIDNAMVYVKRLELALMEQSTETLAELLDITVKTSASTWDLVYANLGVLKTMGLTNEQYKTALHNINSMRTLADSAVKNIMTVNETLKDTKDRLEEDKKAAESLLKELEDLQDSVEDYVDVIQDYIKSTVEEQIKALEDEKDAQEKLIDLKKKQLDLEKESEDHKKSQAKKLKEIAVLQSKIDALALDDSREAQAKRAKYLEELAELQEDLNEEQRDFAIDLQKEQLDKEYDEFCDEKDAEIAKLKDSISSAEKLYRMAIEMIRKDGENLFKTIKAWNYQSGTLLEKDLLSIFDNAKKAANQYGSLLDAITGGIETDIKHVKGQIEELTAQLKELSSTSINIEVGPSGDKYDEEAETVSKDIEDLIRQMRANSVKWYGKADVVRNEDGTVTSVSPQWLSNAQRNLIKQYEELTGDTLSYNSKTGTWERSNGSTLFTLTPEDKDDAAQEVVKLIRATESSLASGTLSPDEENWAKDKLMAYKKRLLDLFGNNDTIERNADGTWTLNGRDLFSITDFSAYHTGGVVGDNPSLKQNEVLAKLEKDEMVLTEKHQGTLFKALSFIDGLAEKLKPLNMLDSFMGQFESGIMPAYAAASAGPSVTFGDVIINGGSEDTIAQHQEINRKFTNEIVKLFGLRRR